MTNLLNGLKRLGLCAFLSVAACGCQHQVQPRSTQDVIEAALTEEFVVQHVQPLIDPIVALSRTGATLPSDLLVSNRIVLVEVISSETGESRLLYENEAISPPAEFSISGVPNARGIGLSIPLAINQPDIELRVNYFADSEDVVAVHIVVPNPLTVSTVSRVSHTLHAGYIPRTPPVSTETAEDLLEALEVAHVDLDLDSPQEYEGALLWEHFANTPFDNQFNHLSTRDWYSNWQMYREQLLTLAEEEGFNVASLKRCLETIAPSPNSAIALLPIGAFMAKKGEIPVWIVVCKWEGAHKWEENGTTQYSTLAHIRMWVLRVDNGEQVDFITCM